MKNGPSASSSPAISRTTASAADRAGEKEHPGAAEKQVGEAGARRRSPAPDAFGRGARWPGPELGISEQQPVGIVEPRDEAAARARQRRRACRSHRPARPAP